ADRGAGDADLGEASAQGRLAGDEARPPRRAALLGVIVGEHHALAGDAVDVWRVVAHQPKSIGADVRRRGCLVAFRSAEPLRAAAVARRRALATRLPSMLRQRAATCCLTADRAALLRCYFAASQHRASRVAALCSWCPPFSNDVAKADMAGTVSE